MLDLIVLFFLTKNMGVLAAKKGLKPGTWKLYTVLNWFAAEIAGAILGFVVFGQENLPAIILLALASAVASYFILKANLSNRPDHMDEDIDHINVADLYPKRKN
jgi:hypothetical protein